MTYDPLTTDPTPGEDVDEVEIDGEDNLAYLEPAAAEGDCGCGH